MDKINFDQVKKNLSIIFCIIIPFLIYTGILIIDLPSEMGDAIRHGFSWLLVIFAILLYITYSIKGWLGIALSLSSTLALFALPLARLWSTGVSESYLLGGLLPWSDANGYYWHTRNLLQGLTMINSPHDSRPIFVGILSFVFKLTQQNLQISIAILTALIAISCFFVVKELQRSYGTTAGVLVILCLFIFIRPLIGSLLTENIGLCLGTLSFALLLRGAKQISINIALLGIFILTIALNARTGTFFVLPTLIFWGGYVFRESKLFSSKFALWGFSVVLLGFIFNSLLLKIIGHPDTGSSYANFALMFYGVITETNWTQIYQDYPEINKLGGSEFSDKTNAIVWETIKNNPIASIKGIIKQWQNFFLDNYKSIFFMERNELESGLRFLGVIGLFGSILKKFIKDPIASLVIFYFFGVIASIPFAPVQDGGLRVYAATVIIFPVLSAIGLTLILAYAIKPIVNFAFSSLIQKNVIPQNLGQLFSSGNISQNSSQLWSRQDQVLPILSLSLVIISFIAPIIIKQISYFPDTSHLSCPVGLETAYFRNNPGSYINLVEDSAIADSHLPNIRISDFREGLKTFAPWLKKEPEAFAQINSGTTIMDTFNYTWLVTNSNLIPQERGFILACGKIETIGELNLFHADYLKPISSKIN